MTYLDARQGRVPEQGGEMEVGIRRSGGLSGLGDFYRAQAVWRCRGWEVVRQPAMVDASMYQLRE
jgi:hypothetical protein